MKINYTAVLFTILALVGLYIYRLLTPDHYLYVSFKDPGDQGVFYAVSDNGLTWEALNNAKPIVKPPSGINRMRDPFVTRDIHNGYHMVYTCGGKPMAFGYAFSEDLIEWQNFKRVKVFSEKDSVLNVWAPELIYDDDNKEWIIFWSSTLHGAFPDTDGLVENSKNHRIYAITTTDFKTFSEPFLFFDPEYPVIDASIFQFKGEYVMLFKDERRWPLKKQLKLARSTSLYGPWLVDPDTITQPWTEGPSVLNTRKGLVLYYDKYSDPQRMEALRTLDLKRWDNINEKTAFPKDFKHGSFLEISAKEFKQLKDTFSNLN